MVEDVVDVSAKLSCPAFTEVEVFVNAEIDAPGARPPEQIALGVGGIGEDIGADGWQAEGSGVPDAVAGVLVVVVAENGWAIGRFGVEITNRIDGTDANVAGLDGIAVVADPERREAGARLGEHI